MAALFLTAAAVGPALADSGKFVERAIDFRGVTYRYQVFLPSDRLAGARPLIMFLHGMRETGYDGKKPVSVGLGPYVARHADDFPAIVVFPQAPDNTMWSGETNEIALRALIATEEEFQTDPRRLYLTGISMGALGTWLLAMENPDRFAAIVPVCNNLVASDASYDDPLLREVARLRDLPTWVFHGAKDAVVPPLHARRMYGALKATGSAVARYSELKNANHNCWDDAYSLPELWTWLFTQSRRIE